MALQSARKVHPNDYSLIQARIAALIKTSQQRGRKAIHGDLDERRALRWIFDNDNAYIVDESYLVLYEVFVPPYSLNPVLSEQFVLSLDGPSSLESVVEFLEHAARATKARMIYVGTALALSDRALAAQYEKHGFRREGTLLTKEL